ncbi:MAG: OFA family MFS transporter [Clostridiales bacterium]|nr:OFA family MFS transporter [Clostridiales bacterium]
MRVHSRSIQAITAQVIMIFAGMVYSWSVLSSPIAEEFTKWSKVQLSFTFTLAMVAFCVGCMIGGFLNGKLKIQNYLICSGVLFFAGFFMASKAYSLPALYLGFGLICGFASGLAYNGVISTLCCWFPEKQGFISGMLLMAFGFGSFIIGKLYQRFTPDVIGAWRGSFAFLGCIIFVMFIIGSFILCAPPEDFSPPVAVGKKKRFVNPVSLDVPAREMITKRTFWGYYIWAIATGAAGLSLISQAGFIAREIGPNVSAGSISTAVGLISIFNALGRVLAGTSFDRFGRRLTMRAVNSTFLVAGIGLIAALKTQSFVLMLLGFILGGLAYGGVSPTNSAFVSSYFGSTHFPINFSIVNSNIIIASFGSTVSGALFDATGSYISVGIFIAFLTVAAIVSSIRITHIYDKIIAKKTLANRALNYH